MIGTLCSVNLPNAPVYDSKWSDRGPLNHDESFAMRSHMRHCLKVTALLVLAAALNACNPIRTTSDPTFQGSLKPVKGRAEKHNTLPCSIAVFGMRRPAPLNPTGRSQPFAVLRFREPYKDFELIFLFPWQEDKYCPAETSTPVAVYWHRWDASKNRSYPDMDELIRSTNTSENIVRLQGTTSLRYTDNNRFNGSLDLHHPESVFSIQGQLESNPGWELDFSGLAVLFLSPFIPNYGD